MAELARPQLTFPGGCPDPGERVVELPTPLPEIGVEFDWDLRDFESFRDAMLEDLAIRYPERKRWTQADLEVVLLEVLAAVTDQFSDMSDRVAAESYLQTARRPESVYNWLRFIGMDVQEFHPNPKDKLTTKKNKLELIIEKIEASEAAESQRAKDEIKHLKINLEEIDKVLGSKKGLENELFRMWQENPYVMDEERRKGPATVHTQKRMSSLADYAVALEEHPLVERAYVRRQWSGSWPVVWVMVSLWNNQELDESLYKKNEFQLPEIRKTATEDFHSKRGLRKPEWTEDETLRDILRSYIKKYRSIGQEVFLEDIRPVGIDISLCLQVGVNYYQSEIKREALRVLGRGPGGFFEPGRLKVGEDLHMSDFYERLMNLDGVEHVEVKTFKKVGSLYTNHAEQGMIVLNDNELAVCDNDSFNRKHGLLMIQVYGGRNG